MKHRICITDKSVGIMNFNEYIGLFHDGGLESISHARDEIKLRIVSAEILPEWNKDHLILDEYKCISGTIVCRGINAINLNGNPYIRKLLFPYDSGEILDFDLNNGIVEMGINWTNYPPHPEIQDYWALRIKAKQIIWQDALNPICLDLTGMKTGKYKI
ncbi:MAG: hypothetical protein JSR80_04370 [Verrucomicrobia bacterium]|nr:hypothetical protein [Verrucomicrobiota bacterium]